LFIVKTPLIGLVDHVNTYVIKTDDENIIIDGGPDFFLSIMVLRKSMRRLNVRLDKSSFIVTHAHRDHIGVVRKLAVTPKVYIGYNEFRRLMRSEEQVKEMLAFAVENGFPERLAKSIIKLALGVHSKNLPEMVPLRDGEVLEFGCHRLKCVETPGHTQGHVCLYDQDGGVLFSGDHILRDITPNISSWSYEEDPLSAYLLGLKKVCDLNPSLVLPGHGRALKNLRGRVQELVNHHEERLLEIVRILEAQSGNAYWVSSKVTWKIRYHSWECMPILHRWLAFEETLAHLNFLARLGVVDRKVAKGKTFYQVVNINAAEAVKKAITNLFHASSRS
jgi:glyoxylase-like metal-dependent hydrolase (beta-lactamase superfamily II)